MVPTNLFLSRGLVTVFFVLSQLTLAQDCQMEMWVFDTQERCSSVNPPNAVGSIYADGKCHTVETSVSTSSSAYQLFPGNYRAECTSDRKIRFNESGCIQEDCSSSSLLSSATCDRNNAEIAALYSRLTVPEYLVQDTADAAVGGLYTCLRLFGTGINVTFVIFGDCTQSGCMVDGVVNPSAPTAPTPTVPPPTPEPIVTDNPVRSPTDPPAPPPTPAPVSPPTTSPIVPTTMTPTGAPADTPITKAPSPLPSEAPIAVGDPTQTPSIHTPTIAPTRDNTTSPGSILSNTVDVGLRLTPMKAMLPNGQDGMAGLALWEAVTASHIKESAESTDIRVIRIEITDVSQMLVTASRQRRALQEPSLDVLFTLSMTYSRDDPAAPSVLAVFLDAFNSEDRKNKYVGTLVNSTDSNFSSLRTVSVVSNSNNKVAVPVNDSGSGSSGGNIGIAVGVTVGILVALVISGFFLYRQKKKSKNIDQSSLDERPFKSKTKEETPSSNGHETAKDLSDPQPTQQRWTNEIVVDPSADDVSTLGGSVLAGLNLAEAGNHGEDEPTASVNLDYDFDRQQYKMDPDDLRSRSVADASGTAFTNFTKLGMLGESVFADDVSFEQQYADEEGEDLFSKGDIGKRPKPFEVRAPPGMLGMVIDTPNAGVPVVRAIKPDSILNGRVQIGDRLISVDHQDVTSMTALEVSNLISVKSNRQRLLVFVRLTSEKA